MPLSGKLADPQFRRDRARRARAAQQSPDFYIAQLAKAELTDEHRARLALLLGVNRDAA